MAGNLLARTFTAARPNQSRVGDTTELIIPWGKLYLAVIVDLYSRFVSAGRSARRLTDTALGYRTPMAYEAEIRRTHGGLTNPSTESEETQKPRMNA